MDWVVCASLFFASWAEGGRVVKKSSTKLLTGRIVGYRLDLQITKV